MRTIFIYLLLIIFAMAPNFSVSYEWELGMTCFILVALWFLIGFRNQPKSYLNKYDLKFFSASLVILIFWITICSNAYLIDFIPQESGVLQFAQENRSSSDATMQALPAWSYLVAFPIFEELIFRKILVGQFIGKISSYILVLTSALLFSLAHIPSDDLVNFSLVGIQYGLLHYFLSGIASAFIYLRFGLFAAIFYHIYWNTFIYVGRADNNLRLIFLCATLSLIICELVFRFYKYSKKKHESNKEVSSNLEEAIIKEQLHA